MALAASSLLSDDNPPPIGTLSFKQKQFSTLATDNWLKLPVSARQITLFPTSVHAKNPPPEAHTTPSHSLPGIKYASEVSLISSDDKLAALTLIRTSPCSGSGSGSLDYLKRGSSGNFVRLSI